MTKIGRITGKRRAIISVDEQTPALTGGVSRRIFIEIIEISDIHK
jgi:hypothetical protein